MTLKLLLQSLCIASNQNRLNSISNSTLYDNTEVRMMIIHHNYDVGYVCVSLLCDCPPFLLFGMTSLFICFVSILYS